MATMFFDEVTRVSGIDGDTEGFIDWRRDGRPFFEMMPGRVLEIEEMQCVLMQMNQMVKDEAERNAEDAAVGGTD